MHVFLQEYRHRGDGHCRGREQRGQSEIEKAAPQRVKQARMDNQPRILDLTADVRDGGDISR